MEVRSPWVHTSMVGTEINFAKSKGWAEREGGQNVSRWRGYLKDRNVLSNREKYAEWYFSPVSSPQKEMGMFGKG